MYFNIIISYSFTTARPPPPPPKKLCGHNFELIKYIYTIFQLLLHIAMHALSPLILWYWCNMHIQLLSFKVRCLSQRFWTIKEFKSTAASWNATLSCLLSSYFAIPRGQLRMQIASIYETFEDIASSAYVKTLAYTTGTTSKHQRATWPELYRKLIAFLRIVVWHMRVSARLLYVWGYGAGCCDVIKNSAKNAFLLRIFKICS